MEVATRNDDEVKELTRGVSMRKWKAPLEGVYKINTDAAMFEGSQIGLGGVVRDHVGDVVVGVCEKMQGSDDVAVVEALSARQGLKVAMEAGFLNLILEVDNIRLYQSLQTRRKEESTFGFIVRDILTLKASCANLVFSHVKREGNRVAHCLAKLSKNCNHQTVWLEEVPQEATIYVLEDKFAE